MPESDTVCADLESRQGKANLLLEEAGGSLEFKVGFVCLVSFRSGLHVRPCLKKASIKLGKITNCTSELVILWTEFLSSIFFTH